MSITTKRRIQRSFLNLLSNNSYEKIAIKDIVKEVGIARQTFYLHYKDKNALFEDIVTALAEGLIALIKKSCAQGFEQSLDWLTEPYHPVFLEYFRYMRTHSEDFITLIHTDEKTGFSQRFIAKVNAYHKGEIEEVFQAFGNGECAYTLQVYGTAMRSFISGLLQWVSNGMKPDEKLMATHYTRMWISNIILLKDLDDNWIYQMLVEKMNHKQPNRWDWMIYFPYLQT